MSKTSKPRMTSIRGFVVSAALCTLLGFSAGACDAPRSPSAETLTSQERIAALRSESLPEPYARLVAIAVPLRPPGAGDWLAVHDERGQSLAEFRAQARRKPVPGKDAIVLARLGVFGPDEDQAFAAAIEMLEAFYGLPVRRGDDLVRSESDIPEESRRAPRGYGTQVRTGYVVDSLLVPHMPQDAFAFIALSGFDLYPKPEWNFVFGQARPKLGVGVWSIVRFRDPPEARTDERPMLARTLRTATHEVGHLLGIAHCVTYRCLMNGSNSLEEHDDRPFELCPVCMAKACEALQLDPVERAARVEAVLRKLDLNASAAHERRVRGLLEGPAESPAVEKR